MNSKDAQEPAVNMTAILNPTTSKKKKKSNAVPVTGRGGI
jgi:hypothetical protein